MIGAVVYSSAKSGVEKNGIRIHQNSGKEVSNLCMNLLLTVMTHSLLVTVILLGSQ